jgi:hypothetical protein
MPETITLSRRNARRLWLYTVGVPRQCELRGNQNNADSIRRDRKQIKASMDSQRGDEVTVTASVASTLCAFVLDGIGNFRAGGPVARSAEKASVEARSELKRVGVW